MYSANYNIMKNAIEKAAKGLKRDFGELEQLQSSIKLPKTFLSTAKRRTEKILKLELARARTDIVFSVEDKSESIEKKFDQRWVIDPIDGSSNFINGIPYFAISIVLENPEETLASLIYNPILDDLYYAEKGRGTTYNNQRVRVSAKKNLSDAIIAIEPYDINQKEKSVSNIKITKFIEKSNNIRALGSSSLSFANVASGRFDCFFGYKPEILQIGAGALLVKEAGGFVNYIEENEKSISRKTILAANPFLFKMFNDGL